MNKFLDDLQIKIENYLTARKDKKDAKKNREKTVKSEALDWLNSLLFAVVVVFFVSLYFVQLFVIPSVSMQDTLAVGDRVGVFKRSYGTELFAFGPKSGEKTANRGDIVIFYNPEYKSKGALRENISNALFLITLSLYNPSKEEKLFVKRAIGHPGDSVRIKNGDVFIKPYSADEYISEKALSEKGKYFAIRTRMTDDMYTKLSENAKNKFSIQPYNTHNMSEYHRFFYGTYIPEGHILPLGDNRDNSYDGRFFGPVNMKSVIGRCVFKFWPINGARFFN